MTEVSWRKSMRDSVAMAAVLAARFPGRLQAQGQPQATLKVIVFPSIANLGLISAQKQGAFSKRGLNVQVQNTPNSEVLRTGLAKGDYHIAHAAVDNAVDMVDVALPAMRSLTCKASATF